MSVYNVSYDLMNPGQRYERLVKELETSPDWWHFLQSTWLIRTHETASQLSARLRKHLDPNDRLLVMEVGKHYDGWLTEEAWAWINQRLAA